MKNKEVSQEPRRRNKEKVKILKYAKLMHSSELNAS